MGRDNLFKTLNVSSILHEDSITRLLTFLMTNRGAILPTQKKSELFRTRFSGSSPIADLVQSIAASGKDKTYSLLRLPTKMNSLPECIDMTFITMDVMQMKSALKNPPSSSLVAFPEINDRVIVNISDLTKANGDFSDVSQFHGRIVKDFLSRSYYNSSSPTWISPTFVRHVAKVYSMTVAAGLAGQFKTTPVTENLIKIILSLFYVGKMTSPATAVSFVKANARDLGLYDIYDLDQIAALSKEVLGTPIPTNIVDVTRLIAALDISEIGGSEHPHIDVPIMNRKFMTIFSDSNVSRIALEYPPYFAYILLSVASGIRCGLSFSMAKFKLDSENRKVMQELVRNPAVLSGL
jgi:hypothetical protein